MIHQPSIIKRLEDTVYKDFVDVAQTDLTQRQPFFCGHGTVSSGSVCGLSELCLCMRIATSCAVGRVDYVLYIICHLSTCPPNRDGSRDMSRREKVVQNHVERFSPDTLYHLIHTARTIALKS